MIHLLLLQFLSWAFKCHTVHFLLLSWRVLDLNLQARSDLFVRYQDPRDLLWYLRLFPFLIGSFGQEILMVCTYKRAMHRFSANIIWFSSIIYYSISHIYRYMISFSEHFMNKKTWLVLISWQLIFLTLIYIYSKACNHNRKNPLFSYGGQPRYGYCAVFIW